MFANSNYLLVILSRRCCRRWGGGANLDVDGGCCAHLVMMLLRIRMVVVMVVVIGTIMILTDVVICIQFWVIMMVFTTVLILVERSSHREDGCWNRRCGGDVVGEGRSRGGDRNPVGLLSQGSRKLFQLPAVGLVVRWRISAGHNIEIFDLFKKSPTCSWM